MRPILFTVQNSAQSPKGNVLCEASNTLDLHRLTSLILSNPHSSCSGFNWVIDLSSSLDDCYQPAHSSEALTLTGVGILPELLYLSLGLQGAISLICNCLEIKGERQDYFESEVIKQIKGCKRFSEAKAFTLTVKQLARHSNSLRLLCTNPPIIESEQIIRLPSTSSNSSLLWLIYSHLKSIVKVSKKDGATFTIYDPQQSCLINPDDDTIGRIFEDSKRNGVCCGYMYVKGAGDDKPLQNIANHAVHYVNADLESSSPPSEQNGYMVRGSHLTKYGYQAIILENLQNSKIYHQGGKLLKPLS